MISLFGRQSSSSPRCFKKSITILLVLFLGLAAEVVNGGVAPPVETGDDQLSSSESSSDSTTCSTMNNDTNNNNSQSQPFSSSMNNWWEIIFNHILAEDYESLDVTLPGSVAMLKNRHAHLCWHKHSTFLEHLLGVHNILRLWGQDETISRIGLFHSAYSNSYVNLALFDPKNDTERQLMKDRIGNEAEEIVYLFCIIDRQDLVVNVLLNNYKRIGNGNGIIPLEGMKVPHLRNPQNETVFLSAKTLRMLLVFSMADVADQHFGWQDRLFTGNAMVNGMYSPDNTPAKHQSTALWPGLSQPGLWMSYASNLGAILRMALLESSSSSHTNDDDDDDDDGRITTEMIPPVFDNCTKLLSEDDEAKARDLYWSVVTNELHHQDRSTDEVSIIDTLEKCITFNPWAFEPYVLLAQKYLHQNDFKHGKRTAQRALELQLQWGTAWDKRLSFNAWVAWTRVLYQRSEDELDWPQNSFDVNNFGMVR